MASVLAIIFAIMADSCARESSRLLCLSATSAVTVLRTCDLIGSKEGLVSEGVGMPNGIVIGGANIIPVIGNTQQGTHAMGIAVLLSFASGGDGGKKESIKVIGGEAEEGSCFDDDANGFGTCPQHSTSRAGKEFLATKVSTAGLVPRRLS